MGKAAYTRAKTVRPGGEEVKRSNLPDLGAIAILAAGLAITLLYFILAR